MRKVKMARLHDLHVVIPGIGTFENELPPKNKTIPGLSIQSDDNFNLHIDLNGESLCGVPAANVKIVYYAKD